MRRQTTGHPGPKPETQINATKSVCQQPANEEPHTHNSQSCSFPRGILTRISSGVFMMAMEQPCPSSPKKSWSLVEPPKSHTFCVTSMYPGKRSNSQRGANPTESGPHVLLAILFGLYPHHPMAKKREASEPHKENHGKNILFSLRNEGILLPAWYHQLLLLVK